MSSFLLGFAKICQQKKHCTWYKITNGQSDDLHGARVLIKIKNKTLKILLILKVVDFVHLGNTSVKPFKNSKFNHSVFKK